MPHRRRGGPATRAAARLLEGRLRYGQGFADPPRWDEAQRIFQDARDQAVETGDGRREAEAVLYLGLVAQQQGRWDAARLLLQDARARATRFSDPFLASFAERHLADLAFGAKDLAPAKAGHRRSLALRKQAGAAAYIVFARLALAQVLEARGRVKEALTEVRRAARDGAGSGSWRGEAQANLMLVRLLGARGGAAAAARSALAAARAYGDPELVAEAERVAAPVR